MPVSHARMTPSADSACCGGGQVPGLLEVLAQVPDPRWKRGRRYGLVFVLAVATVCALAGARNFREAGDQAADLPQEVLARLGGTPHPLRRTIIAPSEKRIRTLLQALDGNALAKEIVHGITTLDAARGTPAVLAAFTRGHWGIESVHWIRDTA